MSEAPEESMAPRSRQYRPNRESEKQERLVSTRSQPLPSQTQPDSSYSIQLPPRNKPSRDDKTSFLKSNQQSTLVSRSEWPNRGCRVGASCKTFGQWNPDRNRHFIETGKINAYLKSTCKEYINEGPRRRQDNEFANRQSCDYLRKPIGERSQPRYSSQGCSCSVPRTFPRTSPHKLSTVDPSPMDDDRNLRKTMKKRSHCKSPRFNVTNIRSGSTDCSCDEGARFYRRPLNRELPNPKKSERNGSDFNRRNSWDESIFRNKYQQHDVKPTLQRDGYHNKYKERQKPPPIPYSKSDVAHTSNNGSYEGELSESQTRSPRDKGMSSRSQKSTYNQHRKFDNKDRSYSQDHLGPQRSKFSNSKGRHFDNANEYPNKDDLRSPDNRDRYSSIHQKQNPFDEDPSMFLINKKSDQTNRSNTSRASLKHSGQESSRSDEDYPRRSYSHSQSEYNGYRQNELEHNRSHSISQYNDYRQKELDSNRSQPQPQYNGYRQNEPEPRRLSRSDGTFQSSLYDRPPIDQGYSSSRKSEDFPSFSKQNDSFSYRRQVNARSSVSHPSSSDINDSGPSSSKNDPTVRQYFLEGQLYEESPSEGDVSQPSGIKFGNNQDNERSSRSLNTLPRASQLNDSREQVMTHQGDDRSIQQTRHSASQPQLKENIASKLMERPEFPDCPCDEYKKRSKTEKYNDSESTATRLMQRQGTPNEGDNRPRPSIQNIYSPKEQPQDDHSQSNIIDRSTVLQPLAETENDAQSDRQSKIGFMTHESLGNGGEERPPSPNSQHQDAQSQLQLQQQMQQQEHYLRASQNIPMNVCNLCTPCVPSYFFDQSAWVLPQPGARPQWRIVPPASITRYSNALRSSVTHTNLSSQYPNTSSLAIPSAMSSGQLTLNNVLQPAYTEPSACQQRGVGCLSKLSISPQGIQYHRRTTSCSISPYNEQMASYSTPSLPQMPTVSMHPQLPFNGYSQIIRESMTPPRFSTMPDQRQTMYPSISSKSYSIPPPPPSSINEFMFSSQGTNATIAMRPTEGSYNERMSNITTQKSLSSNATPYFSGGDSSRPPISCVNKERCKNPSCNDRVQRSYQSNTAVAPMVSQPSKTCYQTRSCVAFYDKNALCRVNCPSLRMGAVSMSRQANFPYKTRSSDFEADDEGSLSPLRTYRKTTVESIYDGILTNAVRKANSSTERLSRRPSPIMEDREERSSISGKRMECKKKSCLKRKTSDGRFRCLSKLNDSFDEGKKRRRQCGSRSPCRLMESFDEGNKPRRSSRGSRSSSKLSDSFYEGSKPRRSSSRSSSKLNEGKKRRRSSRSSRLSLKSRLSRQSSTASRGSGKSKYLRPSADLRKSQKGTTKAKPQSPQGSNDGKDCHTEKEKHSLDEEKEEDFHHNPSYYPHEEQKKNLDRDSKSKSTGDTKNISTVDSKSISSVENKSVSMEATGRYTKFTSLHGDSTVSRTSKKENSNFSHNASNKEQQGGDGVPARSGYTHTKSQTDRELYNSDERQSTKKDHENRPGSSKAQDRGDRPKTMGDSQGRQGQRDTLRKDTGNQPKTAGGKRQPPGRESAAQRNTPLQSQQAARNSQQRKQGGSTERRFSQQSVQTSSVNQQRQNMPANQQRQTQTGNEQRQSMGANQQRQNMGSNRQTQTIGPSRQTVGGNQRQSQDNRQQQQQQQQRTGGSQQRQSTSGNQRQRLGGNQQRQSVGGNQQQMVGGNQQRQSKGGNQRQSVGGNQQRQNVGENQRQTVGGNQQRQNVGENQRQTVGGNQQRQNVSENQRQTVGGNQQRQNVGENQRQMVGGNQQRQNVGENQRQAVGGNQQRQNVGENQRQTVGGNQQRQNVGENQRQAVGGNQQRPSTSGNQQQTKQGGNQQQKGGNQQQKQASVQTRQSTGTSQQRQSQNQNQQTRVSQGNQTRPSGNKQTQT